MGTIAVVADGPVGAPSDLVYSYIADMSEHHPKFLPSAFSEFKVESGSVGAGTVIQFKITAGGRIREVRAEVAEPEPGRVMTESDTLSSMVTTFSVTPQDNESNVRIECTWQGASGVGGFFERLFAPRATRKLLLEEIRRLDAYARQQGA